MSERDTVHMEIEQLQDKLSEFRHLFEKVKTEKSLAEKEIDHLRHQLESALAARDKYCLETRSAAESREQLIARCQELQCQLQIAVQQTDLALKEQHQTVEHMDRLMKETYEKSLREKEEEKGHVAQEMEVLKKQSDKMNAELAGMFLCELIYLFWRNCC